MFRKSLLLATLLVLTALTSGLTSQIFQRSHRMPLAVGNRCNCSGQNEAQSNFQSAWDQPAQVWNFSDQAPSVVDSVQAPATLPAPAELPQTELSAMTQPVELPWVEETEEEPVVDEPQIDEPQIELAETIEAAELPEPTPQVVEMLEVRELELLTPSVVPMAEFELELQDDLTEVENQLSFESEEDLESLGQFLFSGSGRRETTVPQVVPALETERRQFATPAVDTGFATAPVADATRVAIRSSERTRKAAAGWWLFPLLVLPLLGLFAWQLFAGKRDLGFATAYELEQDLEGSFEGPVAATADADLEITDLEIDFEAVESELEATPTGLESQTAVASLQASAAQTPELEIEADREIREYQSTTSKAEQLESSESDTVELTGAWTKSDSGEHVFVEGYSSSRDGSEVETELGVESNANREEKRELEVVSSDVTDQQCGNQECDNQECCDSNVSCDQVASRDGDLTCDEIDFCDSQSVDAVDAANAVDAGSADGSSLVSGDCDDLTKIRGIGPATAELLNENGITSFEQLANVEDDRLQRLLENAGPQYQMMGWSNWSRQASFAAKSDWKGLDDCYNQQRTDSNATSSVSADSSASSLDAAQADDLTRINGIGPASAELLRENGITRFEQLAGVKGKWLEQLLKNAGPRFQMIDWTTWRRQARFASQGDWKGLDRWFRENSNELTLSSSVSADNNASSSDATGPNDLTRINGIGPASARLLNENGITRFDQLVSADQRWLEDLFTNSGTQFTSVDWTTWGQQAQFASAGDWNGLRNWFQANYPAAVASRRRVGVNKGSKSKRSRRLFNKRTQSNSTSTRAEAQSRRSKTVGGSSTTGASSATDGRDDLTRINGIGPASARLLRENGITCFDELMSAEEGQLERLFENSGTQFSTWREQARFASTGDWDGLRAWYLENRSSGNASQGSQKSLSSKSKSKSGATSTTTTARESVRSTSGSDNLTVINGIGPATAKVLKANGITRFEQVAAMSGAELESIISGSGARFQLVDPTSWPQQAIERLQQFGRCTDTELSVLGEINELRSLRTQSSQAQNTETESSQSESAQPSNS